MNEFFPENEWTCCETYWQSKAEQRTPEWHKQRSGRITASNFGTAIGQSNFSTPDQLADELSGLVKKIRTPQEMATMNYGTDTEPEARQWYARTRKCSVVERGLCVPKWNPRIGASPDGEINQDGLIEIKCPKNMYGPLEAYQRRVSEGWIPPEGYHVHIWPTHYAQIQGTMYVMGREWCDYVVYVPRAGKVFVQRFYPDADYIKNSLEQGLRDFIENKLNPRMLQKMGIPVSSPLSSPPLSSPLSN